MRVVMFFRNLFNLSRVACIKAINWDYYGSSTKNCDIDKGAKIDKTHYYYHISVGFGTAIGPNCRISYTEIGRFCSIGPNLVCGWGIHPINGISTAPAFYSLLEQSGFTYAKENKVVERLPIIIGNDVFIGANVTILDGVTIGDGAVIGAGAVVSKDIPPYAVAVGCPIRVIKYRFTEDQIKKLLEIKWWNRDEETFKNVEKLFYDVDGFIELFKLGNF